MREEILWIYVDCHRCGEVIKTRLLQNELSQNDDCGYIMTKMLMGNRHCFERIEMTLIFGEHRRLIDRAIMRGDSSITAEEYEAAQS